MQFHVEDMMCGGCARSVTAAIAEIDGNAKVETDPPTRTLKVESARPRAEIEMALAEAGFPATAR